MPAQTWGEYLSSFLWSTDAGEPKTTPPAIFTAPSTHNVTNETLTNAIAKLKPTKTRPPRTSYPSRHIHIAQLEQLQEEFKKEQRKLKRIAADVDALEARARDKK